MEKWKDIPGYETYYMVSDIGRVKSLPRNGTVNHEVILKPKVVNGYLTVHLRRSGYSKHKKIHRLVAMAFILNTYEKPCVNHKDGNKQNNKLGNLEWCTYRENRVHALETGLAIPDIGQLAEARGISIERRKKKVQQMDENGVVLNTFNSMTEARRHVGSTSSTMINRVCVGKKRMYKGYIWAFV